jgi:glc operon protein GlcG
MSLTLEEANRILGGALTKAQELNIKISAAVCDTDGRLLAFQRMDSTIWASAYASQGKAVASAAFGRPSGDMADRAEPADSARRRRGRRRSHNHGSGSGADHP